MSDIDWWVAAVGASAAAIATLITLARAIKRRRRRQTAARALALGDRRIEIVAIDERKWKR
jgi:membrane protein implicated in regulation of membrane protease activity